MVPLVQRWNCCTRSKERRGRTVPSYFGKWTGSVGLIVHIELTSGPRSIKALAMSGIGSALRGLTPLTPAFDDFIAEDPSRIELLLKRNHPFGSECQAVARGFPRYKVQMRCVCCRDWTEPQQRAS